MIYFVLLYLVPLFLTLAFGVVLAKPTPNDSYVPWKIIFVLSIFPLINILAAYQFGRVVIEYRD